jgi:O-Antigen ligase
MPIIVLIPGVLCIFALLHGRTKTAFLAVFIPVLVVLPTDYFWRVPHLPPISFVEAALFPLGIGMLLMDTSRWRLTRTDFWMVLFVFSHIYPQFRDRCKGDLCTADWALALFAMGTTAVIPYMAGKLIIEQPGVRKETIRRFSWLLSIISVLSIPEFFTQDNLFRHVWLKFFPDEWQMLPTVTRRGFGRLGGPYAGSEQAGIVLLVGLSFALWLHFLSSPGLEKTVSARRYRGGFAWLHFLAPPRVEKTVSARRYWSGFAWLHFLAPPRVEKTVSARRYRSGFAWLHLPAPPRVEKTVARRYRSGFAWLHSLGSPNVEPAKHAIFSRAKTRAMVLLLTVTLLMTQARGPWIGQIFSLGIASIGKAKKPRLMAVVVVAIFILVGIPAYKSFKEYSSGPRKDFGSEQETAQYRQELLDNYIPVAKEGGAWGWGLRFPVIEGQDSIDNEYLLVWLLQGYVGLVAFSLLLLEGIMSLIWLGIKARLRSDRAFIFSLLGIIIGIGITIGTVYLGSQPYELFFLLIGWSQAVRLTIPAQPEQEEAPSDQILTQDARIRVYT